MSFECDVLMITHYRGIVLEISTRGSPLNQVGRIWCGTLTELAGRGKSQGRAYFRR